VSRKEGATPVSGLDFDVEKASVLSISSQENIASTTDRHCLETLLKLHPLPMPKHDRRIYSILFFCSTYRLGFVAIAIANLSFLAVSSRSHSSPTIHLTAYIASIATAANIFVAILARNDHLINFWFKSAILVSRFAPLSIRLLAARVYSYGGIHTGCATASVAWFVALVAMLTIQARDKPTGSSIAAATIAYTILVLLISIMTLALPTMRERFHNTFELSHRFLGWSVLILLWGSIPVSTFSALRSEESLSHALLVHPASWLLLATTLLVIYPWIYLRRRAVKTTVLSPHALKLTFNHGPAPPCSGIKLSLNPLIETHAMAAIPHSPIRTITGYRKAKGFDLIVSNAGDWTKALIENPPERIWLRGLPAIGMMHVALSFRRVVLVVTGSGIAPILGLFSDPTRTTFNARIVWSTRSPVKTYGEEVVRMVKRADPEAVIVDTSVVGRWDLVALAYSMYFETKAEVVLVMSNGKVTPAIVRALRSRSVPAMGPIFDS